MKKAIKRRRAKKLHRAVLQVAPIHEEALKACEEYAEWWGNFPPPSDPSLRVVFEVGKRSLDAKAAAQEAPLERVKEIWRDHLGGKTTLRELIDALDELVKDGE